MRMQSRQPGESPLFVKPDPQVTLNTKELEMIRSSKLDTKTNNDAVKKAKI